MKIGNIDLTIKIVPNLLTISRFLSIPFIIPSIINHSYYIAFTVFIISAMTDFFDGFIARRYSVTSNTGRLMDALADKLLTIIVAWALFFTTHQLSLIFIIIITSREIIITFIRFFYHDFRIKSSSNGAKWKTLCLYLLLGTVLTSNLPIVFVSELFEEFRIVIFIMEILVLALSLTSLLNYLLQIIAHPNEK